MKFGALGLLKRTSERRRFIVASWHSPHSVTWSWCLTVSGQPVQWPRSYAMRNPVSVGVGLGQMFGFHTYTTNGGRQWSVSLLWVSLNWMRQQPLYYRDILNRERGLA